ncbi:HlyD family efflux transporter periplasmic adaptor subunit [Desulfosporosinus sp. OT]|uniref:efflux RND transporter periplasmic adaptor subunit n=1 Tax=Desulfosporosinus sp. OT TaxID=913865 RepID=UPI000223B036|nr:HlyD family efflux transporter periplasmic adaptor subunit [Desulfosporosinus sp. OT]EGW40284.1 efflux transporter, RND family, MFP subunit [Desulfosporosinus sp. OT]
MNKKWAIIGVMGILALGGVYWGYKHFTTKPVSASFSTAKTKLGDVKKVITATGTVNYPHAITLTFPTSGNSSSAGKIVELNVKEGDTIKAGEILAKIDETKLKTAVLEAQANVTTAESQLQNLKDSFNEKTRAEAQATLAEAQQSLTSAKQNAETSYLANQVTLAEQKVKLASNNLAKAQQGSDTSSIQSAQTDLNEAMESLTSAKNLQNGGADKALVAAQANVISAQYEVDQQNQGPTEADTKSALANIQIAQASLASAKADLNDAAIIAPVDAVVVSCPLELGQDSDTDSIITITPVGDKLEVDASIDQSDITQCKVGQKVDITLDAYPNDSISGTVNSVALQGTTSSNVTTYNVTATVDQNSDLLRAGMNANVNIIVSQVNNVLTVPSEAIKTSGNKTGVTVPMSSDASTGQANSNSQTSSQANNAVSSANSGKEGNALANVRFIEVETGLDDGTNVEIKSGLKEGQEVITATTSTTSTTKSSSSSGGLMGGPSAGGPPPN